MTQPEGEALSETQTAEKPSLGPAEFTRVIQAALEQPEFMDRYSHSLYKRETHVKKETPHLKPGEHVVVYFNSHITDARPPKPGEDKLPELFVQITPPGKAAARNEEPEFYRWDVSQDPQTLFPDQAMRIWEAINLFQASAEEVPNG